MIKHVCLALLLPVVLITGVFAAPAANYSIFEDRYTKIVSTDNQSICVGFNLIDIERKEVVKDNETFDAYVLPGEGMTYEYGKPVLPLVSRFVVVPPDVGIELIINADEPRHVKGDHSPAICNDEEAVTAAFQESSSDENTLYPPFVAEMSDPTIVRGARMVKITTYPIRYDAATNSYLEHGRIETELRFTDDVPVNPARMPIRRNRSANFLKVIRSMTLNGDQIGRDDPDEEPEYIGHYCVTVESRCLQYAAPFIEWRRKSGYKVDIFVPNNPSDGYGIKRLIQELYDQYIEDGIDPFDLLMLVGDRPRYTYGPGAQWQLAAPSAHSDHEYGCLEGRDSHMDVGVSRMAAGSQATLQLAFGRTLMYEATPDMEDTEWFNRALAYSQHWGNSANYAWHISQPANVRWGVSVLEHLGFTDITHYENYSYDQFGQGVGQVILEHLNEGASILIGRAENYYHVPRWGGVRDFNQSARDNTKFPMNICTNGHGEWSGEVMFRTGNGNHLKGYVTTSFTWSGPRTLPNSAVWLEMVKTVLLNDLPFGWGYSVGLTAYERYCQADRYGYNWYRANIEAWGDPGIQPWIGVPKVAEAEFPETITPDTRMIEVHVVDASNDDDLTGAQVTLYSPGNMPDFDEGEYATYDEMFMVTKKSDADGMARFVFDEEVFDYRYNLFLTVTGRDICPLLEEIEVERCLTAIDLADYTILDANGNGVDEINPNDTLTLEISAVNLDEDNVARDVTAIISSLSPWVEVEENEISFDDIEPEGTADGDEGVIIIISPACPDGEVRPSTRPELLIEFRKGDEIYRSGIKLDPSAPRFSIRSIIDGEIIPTEVHNLDIDLENIGRIGANNVRARLSSHGMGVSISRDLALYNNINAGGHNRINGNTFQVSGNQIVPPGFRSPLIMIVTCNSGFVDTVHFELQVEEPRENAPSPPDNFGYMCFDDTDEGWEMSPEYEWIEISTRDRNPDFEGTLIEFDGRQPHQEGQAEVIDLEFTSRLYGYDFDQITVATSGFISIGDQEIVTNFQNWPMDRAIGGGVGMLAPLWDDLRLSQDDAGVYYYYDEDDSRMIIEWYKLRHASNQGGDLTFEVIIHDAAVWIVEEGGNPFIVFQYKTVANVGNVRPGGTPTNEAWDNCIPYASVGISSPDGYGINYTFNNRYPVWAAELDNRRALLFTTTPRFKSGCLEGTVTDVATREPIADVLVYTKHGFTTRTDEEGYYFIQDALADVKFDITATKLGYNDSTYIDTLLAENDTMTIDFALLHPEFTPSTLRLAYIMDPELTVNLPFTIENTGNGPLDWALARRLPGNADVDPWVHRLSFPITEETGDTRIEGLVFTDGRFYLSGANIVGRADSANMIWVLDSEGALLDSFPQLGTGTYGMRDLAWDGELIWGSGEQRVYGFTTEGDSATSFVGPFSTNSALAWDLHREVLWVARKTGNEIFAYNRRGEEIDSLALDQKRFRIYGLAYWQDDPDHYSLYILHSPDNQAQMLYKMNPVNGDTMFVTLMEPEGGGAPGGAFATNQFDVYSWVFMNIANDANRDRLDIWQIDARRDWFRVFSEINDNRTEIYSGRIDAQVMQDFELQLSSVDLPDTTFIGMLTFGHNAEGGETIIDVELDVIGPMRPTEFVLLYPENGSTVHANPSYDSTMVVFTWAPSFDYNQDEDVSYQALFKSGDESVYIECDVCSLMVEMQTLIDDLGIPVDAEFQLEWWVFALSGEDARESNDRFELRFEPHGLDDDGELPVEFGLRSIYPSPFNAMTTVRFGADRNERISLRVYDLQGRLAATLWDRVTDRGYHHIVWDAALMPSGLYIVRLAATGRVETAKVALIR